MVRGYWGDIVNSPYLCFGSEVWEEDERKKFFRKINYQTVYSNADISEYNVQAYIHRIEEMGTYEYRFERLRTILGKKYDDHVEIKKKEEEEKKKAEEKGKSKKQKKREKDAARKKKAQEEVNEEPMIEEITDE